MISLPLLEKHRVQVRLIFSLFTVPSAEMRVRIPVLLVVVDMDVKGLYQSSPRSPSLATWLLPAQSRVLFTLL